MSNDADQGLISKKFHLNIFFCFLAWETLLNAFDHSIQFALVTRHGFHCKAWRGKTKLFWSPGTICPPCDEGECNCRMHACHLYSQSCHYSIQFFVQVKFWIFEWQKVQSYFFSNWKRLVKEASNMGRSEMKTVRTERKWMRLKHLLTPWEALNVFCKS